MMMMTDCLLSRANNLKKKEKEKRKKKKEKRKKEKRKKKKRKKKNIFSHLFFIFFCQHNRLHEFIL
jgi:membrane-anchored glycerophosphoryl diester phosphodiesterase (GDPDase)